MIDKLENGDRLIEFAKNFAAGIEFSAIYLASFVKNIEGNWDDFQTPKDTEEKIWILRSYLEKNEKITKIFFKGKNLEKICVSIHFLVTDNYQDFGLANEDIITHLLSDYILWDQNST